MSERIKKAEKRYYLEFFGAMALYVAVLFAAKTFAKGVEPGPLLTVLALAPQVPVALACFAFMRFFFSADERERRLIADAAAIALLAGIFSALTIGFLHSFGVFKFEWDMVWFGPYLISLWGVVRCILQVRN